MSFALRSLMRSPPAFLPQLQAKVAEAQAPGDRWFHLGQEDTGIPCPERVCVLGGTIHTSYYQLPPGLVCDGVSAKCVLQWHWVTGNSCNPPGEPAQYSAPSLPDCATDSWAYPEEVSWHQGCGRRSGD